MDKETAVKLLSNVVKFSVSKQSAVIIAAAQANEIADFIERQEPYAELGRLAVEAMDNIDSEFSSQPCDEPVFDNVCRSCKSCLWHKFCAKRAELEEVIQVNGIDLIAAERKRQVEQEGWTPAHDRRHEDGELAFAAACYALPEAARGIIVVTPKFWPWDLEWWKPTPDDRIRELQKAGALIAAEIDRLRAEGGNGSE